MRAPGKLAYKKLNILPFVHTLPVLRCLPAASCGMRSIDQPRRALAAVHRCSAGCSTGCGIPAVLASPSPITFTADRHIFYGYRHALPCFQLVCSQHQPTNLPLLLRRAGRALKQVGVTVTNNCGEGVFITASYPLNSSNAADYTQCVNGNAQEIMHCFEYMSPSGGYPDGEFAFEVTGSGEAARTAGTIPSGEFAYVAVSYVFVGESDPPRFFPGGDAILEGYDPVWLSASGKECPEGFEESCSLTYKVGCAFSRVAHAGALDRAPCRWIPLCCVTQLGQARRDTAHPSSPGCCSTSD